MSELIKDKEMIIDITKYGFILFIVRMMSKKTILNEEWLKLLAYFLVSIIIYHVFFKKMVNIIEVKNKKNIIEICKFTCFIFVFRLLAYNNINIEWLNNLIYILIAIFIADTIIDLLKIKSKKMRELIQDNFRFIMIFFVVTTFNKTNLLSKPILTDLMYFIISIFIYNIILNIFRK